MALDKKADILIADHLRKDCPPNSYSWRLIEESVKEGRLLDKEDYPAGRPARVPRPIASSQVTKGHRSAFTTADDMILASWATKSDHPSGNKLYMELEASVGLLHYIFICRRAAFAMIPLMMLTAHVLVSPPYVAVMAY